MKFRVLPFILSLFVLIFTSKPAFAADAACTNGECLYGYFGSQSNAILWADSVYHDDDFTRVISHGSGQGALQWFDADGNLLGSSALAGYSDYTFPPGAKGFKIVASTGEFHAIEAWTNNPLSQHIVFQGSDGESHTSILNCDVCQCLDDLRSVTSSISQQIASDLPAMSSTLSSVDDRLADATSRLGSILQETVSFHDEFQTDTDYDLPSAPSYSDRINQNKPSMPEQPFEDHTQYFQDQGDAPKPSKLPKAPEPTDNWDGITRESEMRKDDELNRDPEMQKDAEMTRDNFQRDPEMQKDAEMTRDEFQRDPVMQKDDELTRDSFQRDPEMQKDAEMTRDEFQRDPVMQKDAELSQTEHYQQSDFYDVQENDYPLRWSQ